MIDEFIGLFSLVEIGIGKTYADFSIASCSKPHLLSGILLAPRNYQRHSLYSDENALGYASLWSLSALNTPAGPLFLAAIYL
jgi:hypothetical protein